MKSKKSQIQSSEIQISFDVENIHHGTLNFDGNGKLLAVVEHPKSRFLGKKLLLTTFLGGYVAKKS